VSSITRRSTQTAQAVAIFEKIKRHKTCTSNLRFRLALDIQESSVSKLIIVLLIAFSSFVKANDAFSSDQLKEMAHAFVKAKNSRQQPNTTVKDIDHFISLLADNFIDEHVKYNFIYTDKTKLKTDMIAKMKDKIIFSSIEINELMVGRNVVFIKMTETGKVKPSHLDKIVEYTKTNILSLEFNDKGLIKHIRRHHG